MESTLKVVRVQLDNGERIVGIKYPESLIPLVERSLQEEKAADQAIQQQIQIVNGQPMITQPTDNVPAKVYKTVTEDVNPVLEKCKNKAFTPPVTIINFFKPITKTQVSQTVREMDIETSGSNCQTAESFSSRKKKTKNIFENFKEKSSSDDESPVTDIEDCEEIVYINGDDDNQSSNDFQVDSIGQKSSETTKEFKEICNQKEGEKPESKKESLARNKERGQVNGISVIDNKQKLTCFDRENSAESVTKAKVDNRKVFSASKKRPSTSTSNKGKSTKKTKQSNLFTSFAKQKSFLEMEKKKGRTCPICGKEFPSNAWNTEINDHIDNCLIE